MSDLLKARLRALSEEFFDQGHLMERDACDWLIARLPDLKPATSTASIRQQLYDHFRNQF